MSNIEPAPTSPDWRKASIPTRLRGPKPKVVPTVSGSRITAAIRAKSWVPRRTVSPTVRPSRSISKGSSAAPGRPSRPASMVAVSIGGSKTGAPTSGQLSSMALTWVSERSPEGAVAMERKSTTSDQALEWSSSQARSASSAKR